MEKQELLSILNKYNISSFSNYKELNTSKGKDYRLNIFIDDAYVLRINKKSITEERLQSIARLCERYREIGIVTPKLYLSNEGTYLTEYNSYVCYISEYLNFQTEEDLEDECDHIQIQKEIWRSIGKLSKKYSNVDLSKIYSMWSIIDLAPLDVDIDEKQENLNTLVEALREEGEINLVQQVEAFNIKNRDAIKKVYKNLPRCVIQGDLNCSNILIKENHFIGLIDFNMSGTEVNINHFCAETNRELSMEEFKKYSAEELYEIIISEQNKNLNIILEEYSLNELEKNTLEYYRNIVLLSQYPNVTSYLAFLKEDKNKLIQLLNCIIK